MRIFVLDPIYLLITWKLYLIRQSVILFKNLKLFKRKYIVTGKSYFLREFNFEFLIGITLEERVDFRYHTKLMVVSYEGSLFSKHVSVAKINNFCIN